MTKAINHDTMRSENVRLVLQCIQDHGPVSRKEIKNLTGLSWGSVSFISNSLLEKGLIVETQRSICGKGRNPGNLVISKDYYRIVSVDINRSGLTTVSIDLQNSVVDQFTEPVRIFERDAVLEQIYALLDRMFARENEQKHKILGLAVSMQGSVDTKNGISLYNPYFSGWSDVPLGQLLTERYGCDVIVEHTTECATFYEMKFGIARGIDNFVYVQIGQSLGISTVHNGEFLRGFNGNAGELGHVIVDPEGDVCSCGKRGCLETVATEKSMIAHVTAKILADEHETPYTAAARAGELTMDHIYRAFYQGYSPVCVEVEKTTVYLAHALATVINIVNPEVVVLGGDMVRYESMFTEELRRQVQKQTWIRSPSTILCSTSHEKTAAIGAAMLMLDQVLSGDWISLREVPEAPEEENGWEP